MKRELRSRWVSSAICVGLALGAPGAAHITHGQGTAALPAVVTVPGMPPVADPRNLYSETGAGKMAPAVAGDLPRVYVPHVKSNDVYVIDPATMKVVDKFKVGINAEILVECCVLI